MTIMKKITFVAILGFLISACGGGNSHPVESTVSTEKSVSADAANPSYDPNRGEGKFKDIEVTGAIDKPMAENGFKIYGLKCSSCHKTTDEKLVGPGWNGVTSRHTAAWIMNFITNPDVMLDKDPKAQAQLEICLVRMPNQNLADEDARALYEFMRKNDGIK